LFCAFNYLPSFFVSILESPNDLIADLIFNLSHIIFASFANNNMEGEVAKVVEVAKHATKSILL
jgi:hypothetical protein